MRTSKPLDRNNLDIKKTDKVLEIGPGHNPSYRSNIIAEKFIDTNYHRCGDVKIYPHQTFVNADGENLPFKDKEFDYIICNQVIEHTENPEKFISELCRVGNSGYIETPSLIGEFLFPKESHKWVILDIDNKLVFFEKAKMAGNYQNNYGEVFLNYLPYQSLIYKLLWLTEGDLMTNRFEWKKDIEFIINPEDKYYRSFFTNKWTREMSEKIFPKRSLFKEIIKVSFYLLKSIILSKVIKREPLTISEYMNLKK